MCVACQFKMTLFAQSSGTIPTIEPSFAMVVLNTEPDACDTAISECLVAMLSRDEKHPFPTRLKTQREFLLGALTSLVAIVRLLRKQTSYDGIHEDFRRICGAALDGLKCKDWQEEFAIHIAKAKIEMAKQDHDEWKGW